MAARSALRSPRDYAGPAWAGMPPIAMRLPRPFTVTRQSAYPRYASSSGNHRNMAGGALAQALMANQAALLRYLRARGAGEEAEDCLQDLWIRVEASEGQAVADALAYLYRMAHNLMLDRHRAMHRRQNREQSYRRDVQGIAGDTDDAPATERVLIGRERLRQVDRVLAGLGERTEYIFRRHRVDEIGQKDIAAELGITLSAVEKHLQKAYRAVAAAHRAIVGGGDPSAAAREPPMADPDRKQTDEALDWVRRIHDPSFVDWEGHAVWLEADLRNSRAFDEAALTIEAATASLAPPEPHVASPVPVNDNPPAPASRHPVSWRRGIGFGTAVAAGIVAIVTVPTIMRGHAGSYLVRTGAGEQRSITIDGTTIALNGASRLRLDRTDTRVATLEQGEALFTVRHDPAQPFAVRAGGATFQDIGTIFDVVATSGSTQVAVREGAVLYDPGGTAVRLDGGQSMRIAANAATVKPVDTAAVGGWRTGTLLYRDALLTDVASDVARSVGEPVVVDPALSQQRFSGAVKIDRDRPRMFRRMAAVMGVDIRHKPEGWRMLMPPR